ncbi:cytochrome P450 CYP72A219-like [Mangifera indica]|uniref:cytochrome P450 CYP72A219-like n=1 Tax=Mangifera indica TaxID=29780 RepID=UPI001CFBDD54|nr:cytochrome P450 CYP72A219-like [Mangifera indica]
MEMYDLKSIAVSIVLVTVVTWAWRLLNWVWFRPKKYEKYMRQQGLKGKPYRFLYGDLKEEFLMIKEAKSRPLNLSDDLVPLVLPFIDKLVKDYGDNSFMWFGTVPRVIITNPNQVKEILTKINDFQISKGRNPLVKKIVTGLLEYEGEKWTKHRRIINPAFHQEKLKLMLPSFYKVCSELVIKWEKLVNVAGSCEIDVWPELQKLTGDVISQTAFGSNYEEGRRIFQLQAELVDLAMQAAHTFYIPGLRFLPTKRNKRIKEIDNEVRALLMDIIENREKAMKAGEAATNDDLLGILMESNFKEIKEHGNNKNVGMTINEVIEECKLFYLAGQETTAVLLVWTLTLLSEHLDWQARAREEVLQVFGDQKPDSDGLNHLKVISMILYEVLRLYPPVVVLPRAVYKDIKLGNLLLPAGVEIFLPIVLVHHDKGLWGEDAKEFKPERFSEGISKATKHQASFFPFGWGSRICIGQNFSITEAKIALAMILQMFTWELSPSYVHCPHRTITIRPEYGAHLILKKVP